MEKRVSVETVMSWIPCKEYTEERVRKLFGKRKTVSAKNILAMDIPSQDKLWAVLRPELIDEPMLFELACRFSEAELPVWDEWAKIHAPKHLYAPARAIDATRAWAAGEIGEDELAAALDAAWVAGDAAVASVGEARAAALDAAEAAGAASWVASRAGQEAAEWVVSRQASRRASLFPDVADGWLDIVTIVRKALEEE